MKALFTIMAMMVGLSSASAQEYFENVGDSATVDFNGYLGDINTDPVIDGLTAQLMLELTGTTGTDWTFAVTLTNTSGAPITASRIGIFGFNVAPDASGISFGGDLGANLDTDVFGYAVFNGGAPHGFGSVEVCIRDGNGNCNGDGGSGLEIGEYDMFEMTITTANTTGITLDDFFVRYQSIYGLDGNGREIGGDSGLGIGITTVVPEPSTWVMMILGFGIVASAARRRRKTAEGIA